MTEKTKQLLDLFLAELPADYADMFMELAYYAVSLGYTPKKTKSKNFVLDFSKSKVKRTIMKMEIHDNAIETRGPGLRLKFFANKDYSIIFQNGIKRVIEGFGGKYTGCYGCGRCKGDLEGYTYIYPDGKSVFRCGGELIAVYDFTSEHISEIKNLLKVQDDFFMSKTVL